MLFGTLRPIAPWLRDFMGRQGIACMSCDAASRIEYPLGLLRLMRCLRQDHVDILHTHLFEPSVVGLLAGVLAKTPARIMTRHYSNYHTRIGKTWHVRADQLCNKLSHAVIAVSQHTADHIVCEEGAPPDRVEVVLNGIDFSRLELSDPARRVPLRREWSVDDAYIVLVPGRLHPEKGHSYFFQALPLIRRQLSRPLVALIAGAGPFEAAYREEVRSLGCADMVKFLGFRRDVADLIAAADIVVLPSVAEAFGLVVAEALYLGTPVVATLAGGIPEIVRDGIDGVLVPPADSRALAEAVGGLLNDPSRRARLAGAGRERVGERFGFERMVRAYEQTYEQVLQSWPQYR
jgi:glycosyltransferase involved in cell wall biosynthesis